MSRAAFLRYTIARYAWLERLRRERVVAGRPRGRTGCDCMHLGLTQWVYGDVDRDLLGEALTARGREVLEQWRRANTGRSII